MCATVIDNELQSGVIFFNGLVDKSCGCAPFKIEAMVAFELSDEVARGENPLAVGLAHIQTLRGAGDMDFERGFGDDRAGHGHVSGHL